MPQDTRAVFKCGMYEVMRTMFGVIKECRDDFRRNQRLLKGMFSLGWLCVRPDFEKKKMVDCTHQKWCKDMKLGSHRIKEQWLEKRFSHLDKDGKPQPEFQKLDENLLPDDVDQTYNVDPGAIRSLDVWKQMAEAGQITLEQLKEFQEEPWFEIELTNFENIQGIERCQELLQTPAQQRAALGIDPNLTSQRKNVEQGLMRKRSRQLKNLAREPLRKQAASEMRKLKADGYSIAQISAAVICPSLGKGKKGKKKLRDQIVSKLTKKQADSQKHQKATKALAAASSEKKDDEEQVFRNSCASIH